MSPRAKAYLYLLLTTVIWGAASPIIKFTLGGIEPFPFLAYRFAISGVISLIFLFTSNIKIPRSPEKIKYIIIYGLLATTFALGFLFYGLKRTTVIELGLISAIEPLAIAFAGVYFLREHISKHERLGMFIAFFGTLITIFYPMFNGGGDIKFSGNIFLLFYLISDGSSVLIAKKMTKKGVDPFTTVNLAFLIGALTIIPFAAFTTGTGELIRQITTLPFQYHLGVWYMAIFSGTIAYFLFVKGMKSIEAGEASLFYYLTPVFSIPIAVIWLGEVLTPVYIIGAGLIASGVFIAEYKKRAKKKR